VQALKATTAVATAHLDDCVGKLRDAMTSAAFDELHKLLHNSPETLASQVGIPPGQLNAAEAALHLKKLQKERETLDEKQRLQAVLQTLDQPSGELSTCKRDAADRVRITKAQMCLSFEAYLETTPFSDRGLETWQPFAHSLRNTLHPTPELERLCKAYADELTSLRAHTISQIYQNNPHKGHIEIELAIAFQQRQNFLQDVQRHETYHASAADCTRDTMRCALPRQS
jgi:hypothetical protein